MKKIYLDSCVFIGFLEETDNNHKKILKFIEKNYNRKDIQFYVSSWTLTETLKVLLVNKNWNVDKVRKISEDLLRSRRLGDLKFSWLPSPTRNGYDLDEFFYDFQQKIFLHRIGTGDLMHIVLCEIHNINVVLTFNIKDFCKFKEIKAIQPNNLSRYKFK